MKKFILVIIFFASSLSPAQEAPATSNSINQTASQSAASTVKQSGEPTANYYSPDGLSRFGVNLFRGQQVVPEGPVGGSLPENYRLGPGDQLGIYLGGKANEHFQLVVTTDGKLFIPTVGVIFVNGLTLKKFRQKLDEKLATYYSNYSLNIMLITPKRIGVSVIGEVKAPGNYSGSALNTVLDFINMAQGPTLKGSLRNIQIYRNDKIVSKIDLYDFLLRPKGHQYLSLQNGDKIFIPVLNSSVTIEGEVNREAIYELHPENEERLCELVELAGGFTDVALQTKIKISNTQKNGEPVVRYADLSGWPECDSTNNPVLNNNDHIRVFSVVKSVPDQKVAIYGEVEEPGMFDWEKNMQVSDLVLQAGGLTRKAYLLTAEIAKIDPGRPVQKKTFNLNPSSLDIVLEPDDQVFIRRIPDWQVGPLVHVQGEVQFPGYYPITLDSTRLSHIINDAGGFTDEALVSEAQLIREQTVMPEDKEYERLSNMSRADMSETEYEYLVMKENTRNVKQIVVDFTKIDEDNNSEEDVLLKDGDEIIIPKKPHVIFVTGRVSKPGGVMYSHEKDLDYYIRKAGGYTWDADRRRTKIIKTSGEIINDEDCQSLEAGDRVWVPREEDIDYWQIFHDVVMMMGQLATVYLVLRNAARR